MSYYNGKKILGIVVQNGSGGSDVVLDPTLSIEGMAADAKAVGDKIKALEENGGNVDVQINGTSIVENGVANIPYATDSKAGVSRVSNYRGMKMLSGGIIAPIDPTTTQIENRNNGSDTSKTTAVTLNMLDYAIKKGLTTNTETLTEEEKAQAQAWLGVKKLYAHDIYCALRINEEENNTDVRFRIYSTSQEEFTSGDIHFYVGQVIYSVSDKEIIVVADNTTGDSEFIGADDNFYQIIVETFSDTVSEL